MERAFNDARKIADMIDAVDALAEGPVDLRLVGILMQVEFLMRMLAVVVRRDIAGDDDHRNRVERRVGHTGRRVGQSRAEMGHDDAGLARGARIAIRCVRGDLLVAHVHELD